MVGVKLNVPFCNEGVGRIVIYEQLWWSVDRREKKKNARQMDWVCTLKDLLNVK